MAKSGVGAIMVAGRRWRWQHYRQRDGRGSLLGTTDSGTKQQYFAAQPSAG